MGMAPRIRRIRIRPQEPARSLRPAGRPACQAVAMLQRTRRTCRKGLHTLVARGEVRSHRRCRFQAAFLQLESAEDVAPALAAVCSEKRIARATHPHIAAWRLSDGEVGYDDCGESGAGKRLLQLLERRGVVGGLSHRTHAAT
jgi:hypothetical protein